MDSLYSALEIKPGDPFNPVGWKLFTYSQGMLLPWAPSAAATLAHTNIPRVGYAGLPRSWEMSISQWRATTNLRTNRHALALQTTIQDMVLDERLEEAIKTLKELDGALIEPQPVLDWAADTTLRFVVNGQQIVGTPLLDLLQRPHPIVGDGGYGASTGYDYPPQLEYRGSERTNGFRLRENVDYQVDVEPQRQDSWDALVAYLAENKIRRMTLWLWLEGRIRKDA